LLHLILDNTQQKWQVPTFPFFSGCELSTTIPCWQPTVTVVMLHCADCSENRGLYTKACGTLFWNASIQT